VGQVSYQRQSILMFRWKFDHSDWGRFHACVVWILDSYITQPTYWSLPYREAYFHPDTHHWPQKEYAHENFRHTKPLSDPMSHLTYCLQIVGMFHLMQVAGSIFGPLFQTHISKSEFKNEISSSALLDIQLTLFCVCGVDSFLPELEHL